MRKILIFGVICLFLAVWPFITMSLGKLLSPPAMPPKTFLSTPQQSAISIASVTADATALAYNTSSWADAKALFIEIPLEWNYTSWSFYGYGDGDGAGSPANATFSYNLYLIDYYGGAELVISGATGTIGAQQLSHDPVSGAELNSGAVSANYCWADTLSETAADWPSTAYWSNNSAADTRAKGRIDRLEAYGVYICIYNMTAQPVSTITAVMTGG
jgi:hypothetical protein